MEYIKELKKTLSDTLLKPTDTASKLFRVFILALPVLVYVVLVFIDNSKGERVVHPSSVLEHLGVLVFSYVLVYAILLSLIWIMILAESGKLDPMTRTVSEFFGFPAEGPRFKRMKALAKYLKHQTPSLTWICDQMRVVKELEMQAATLQAYTPRFLAKYTAARNTQRSLSDLSRFETYTRSTSAYAEALAFANEKFETTCPGSSKDETLVYFSVSGRLSSMFESVLISRHLVAGDDPLDLDPQWTAQWHEYRLVGDTYDFVALVCAPRWLYEIRLGHVSEKEPDYLYRITETYPASATYKDTVSNLWDEDRWGMYHQPLRLVKAAQRLDRNRRGGHEYWVP